MDGWTETAAVWVALVLTVILTLLYWRLPDPRHRPNPNKGWWTHENMAKGDAHLGGCLIFAVCCLGATYGLFLLLFRGVGRLF